MNTQLESLKKKSKSKRKKILNYNSRKLCGNKQKKDMNFCTERRHYLAGKGNQNN